MQETHDALTDEADRLESGDLEVHILSLIVDEAKQDLDDLRPLVQGKLDSGDSGDDLSGEGSGSLCARAESHERLLLDLVLRVVIQSGPALQVLLLSCRILQTCVISMVIENE